MGLNKQYLKVGQSAKNKLFGISPSSQRGAQGQSRDKTPLQMLVSEQGKISHGRLAVICLGLFAIAIGIILSSIPWLDYLILKNLRLFNGTLSYYYWQRPGVLRLTKVFIFNVTNPEGFLAGEKPRLQEIGPFVYRENMEKVNIAFHDNGTVSFQHKKILEFLPEMSVDKNLKIVVPNIPLLTLTSALNGLSRFTKLPVEISLRVFYSGMKPFKEVTADELIFGYDDRLTSIAHVVYPRGKRPPQKMGLLLGRNGTLHEVSTIHTGQTTMENFGLLDRINGLDHLPYWESSPCNSINASEGSLFPPRSITNSDLVHVYDKDLCRVWPLRYRHDVTDNGITVGYYTPDDSVLESGDVDDNNKCFCPLEECPLKGLQNIRPCHFNAPVFLSFPHFYKASPELLDTVEGLTPDVEKHGTYFKIQPKLGVTTEAKVRVQLNLQVSHSDIDMVKDFRSINFPIVWLEEGVSELTPSIHRWVYLSTTFADNVVPFLQYGLIVFGATILVIIFVQAYKNIVFTKENLELGKQKFRRGSSFIVNGQHRLLIIRDSYNLLHSDREQDSYSLIDNRTEMAETSFDPDPAS